MSNTKDEKYTEIEVTVRAEDDASMVKSVAWLIDKVAEFKYGRSDKLTRKEWEDVNNFMETIASYIVRTKRGE